MIFNEIDEITFLFLVVRTCADWVVIKVKLIESSVLWWSKVMMIVWCRVETGNWTFLCFWEEFNSIEIDSIKRQFQKVNQLFSLLTIAAATMRIKMPAMRIAQGKRPPHTLLICIFVNK